MLRTAIAAAALSFAASAAAAAPTPEGVWSMPKGKAQVRISQCGASYCATLVGLRKPNDKQGRPKRDKYNPNPSLRERPVIGLSLVSGLKPDGAQWVGKFYNPDDGRTYDGRITPQGPDRLSLRGCVIGVLCKTQVLTRLQ